MDDIEKLMAEYPELKYKFDKNMPDGLHGLTVDDNIFINDNLSYKRTYQTIAEEIGHYKTSVGDLLDGSLESEKQELRAREWGYAKTVALQKLFQAYEQGLREDYEIAGFLGVTTDYARNAVDMYVRKLEYRLPKWYLK